MFSISTTITYAFNPWYNPYYYFAGAGGGYYGDSGWKVYFVGAGGDDVFQGDAFSDTMWGYGGEDVLQGFGGDDVLYGGEGDDTLNGGTGDDDLYGGDDNDLFFGGAGWDNHYGGNGIDTVDYSSSATHINISMKYNLSFNGDSAGDRFYSIENIIGTDYNDIIGGTDGILGNTLNGGNGADKIWGHGGNDLIIGGNGHDDMWGGTGIDTFEWTHYGGNFVGADRIYDFDANTELLRFRVDNPSIITVNATEQVFEGADGLLVEIIETYPDAPETIRYDVFLDDVTAAEFSTDNYEIL